MITGLTPKRGFESLAPHYILRQPLTCGCLFCLFSPFQIILAVMTKANPTKKREHLLKFLSKKCSLHSKCYIVFYPVNYSYCVTILQIDTKNCCQFVVNSDLGCRKPLILLGFLVQRLHCGDEMVHHSLAVLSSAKFY